MDQHRRIDAFATALTAGIAVAMAAVLARVVQLQTVPPTPLAAATPTRVSTRAVPSMRGELTDARGRLLAVTRPGLRAFIDPMRFPIPPDDAIVALAEAVGQPPEVVGDRVASALARAADLSPRPAPEPPPTDAEIRSALFRTLAERLGIGADHGEGPAGDATDGAPHPLRYARISDVLTDDQVARVRSLDLPGVHLEPRLVREYTAPAIAAPLVGKVDVDHRGLLGVERLFDASMQGRGGLVRYVRDAKGRPLWVDVSGLRPAERGAPVRASIDLELMRIAWEELDRGVREADAAGGRLVMIDPATGAVVAMADIIRDVPGLTDFPWADASVRRADRPALPAVYQRYRVIKPDPRRDEDPATARVRSVEDVYEPGSTFKPFVWSLITEAGLARPDEVFDTEGGRWRTAYGRPVQDVTKRDTMTWAQVLVNSSNIGMVKATERMAARPLHDGLRSFGFGDKPGLGLAGETSGLVQSLSRWSKYTHTSVAFGQEVAATPVQMARAFCVFARDGSLAGTLPTLRLTAPDPSEPTGQVARRVVSRETAELTRRTLTGVMDVLDARLAAKDPPESGWAYDLFGKSGTPEVALGEAPPGKAKPRGAGGYYEGQYNSNFIAGGPVEHPRLVVLVIIEDPGPDMRARNQHYGSSVAGPVVRRVMERSLAYLGVPPTRTVPPSLSAADPRDTHE